MIPYKLVKKGCIYGNAGTDSFTVSGTCNRKFYCLSGSTDKYMNCVIQKAKKTGSSSPQKNSLKKIITVSLAKFHVTLKC